MSILWTGPQLGAGTVTVTGSDGQTFSASASAQLFQTSQTGMTSAFYQYQADVTGLRQGTTYSYSVAIDGDVSALPSKQFTFTTPSAGKFSFLVFGDSGNSSPEQCALVQRMAEEPGISKVVHVGDMAYSSGTFQQFEDHYFGQNAPLMSRLPFFATPGNHEYETNGAAAFVAGHSTPASNVPSQDVGRYYSFDWGDAHFASIDSNLLPTAAAARMLAWLDADLAASGKYWKIVFLHHPPYPTGTHLTDPICALVSQNVNPIVERHGVQLVLSGHEHGYERSWPLLGGQRVPSGQGTTYLISGGGGGFMEDVGYVPQCALSVQAYHYLRVTVDGSQLSYSAIGLNGNVIDQGTLTPKPAIATSGVVSIGDFTPAVASGSLASIFGQNLAPQQAHGSSASMPTELAGVTVTANGRPIPLLYASPTQINVQIPYEVSGRVTLEVTSQNGSASAVVDVAPLAPSIIAVAAQNALCSPANPASQGAYVTVYATGLGTAASPVATGQAAPPGATPMITPVQVWLGNLPLQPSYAGMAPGFVGLNQVNFAVPSGLASGVYPLRIEAGACSSRATVVSIGPSPGNHNATLRTSAVGSATNVLFNARAAN